MKTSRFSPSRVLLLALLALAGSLAVALAMFLRDSARRSTKFADGSRVTVLGASLSGQAFTAEQPWRKTARRWLPAKLKSWLPVPPAIATYGTSNTLTVWISVVDANDRSVIPGSFSNRLPWFWYAPVAEDGFRFSLERSIGVSPGAPLRLLLSTFPRRQREFDLQLLDKDQRPLGSVSVRNPVRGPFVEWVPGRLPITRTNGPLVATLVSLTDTNRKHFGETLTELAAEWNLDRSEPHWRTVESMQKWSDATGNAWLPFDFKEPAWKLDVTFRRSNPTNFSEAEKFVLPPLKVPEPGTLQMLTNEFERLGVTFKLRFLAGAGMFTITNLHNNGTVTLEKWESSRPFFLLEHSKPDPLDQLSFRVIGSNGTDLSLEPQRSVYIDRGVRRQLCQQEFDTTNGVNTITLEGVVNRARTLEFLINPADVRRLGTTSKTKTGPVN